MLSRAGGTWAHSWLHLRSGAGLRGPSCPSPPSVSVQALRLPHLAVEPLPTPGAHEHTYAGTYEVMTP